MRQVSINRTEFQEEFDFFIIHTNEVLEKDKQYNVFIPFKSDLSKGLLGFYRSSYMDKQSNQKRWMAVTQFEATYARLGFPCFDEPDMKAKFDISLGHHKNYTALGNMPILTSEPIANKSDWVLDKFDVTVPMSTYLVAYTINDFEFRESSADGDVVFRIWARRDAISQVEYAKFVGPKVLKFFEKTFKVKYPLPKMDMIAIPDFSAEAMENWGLITYRESVSIFEESNTTEKAYR
ncbi:aminopeptidase N-like [Sitodiplosis mosellana]|uniref:aminopeptidase N-like n=1 Tax=Sitodiplosis mosellana TaxID=263140 RepID=UPI0024451A03|nr:aminopeptidase N-like [Sitodiplosis mosellana]